MYVAGLFVTLTGCFRSEMRTAGKRFSLYQVPGDLFRLEMGTAGRQFSLYQDWAVLIWKRKLR